MTRADRRHSRRDLLRTSLGFAAAAGLPAWWVDEVMAQDAAAAAAAPASPNDMPGVALIGCGGRGRGDAKDAQKFGRVLAVCDVDAAHREIAVAELTETAGDGAPEIRGYSDFRELLDKEKDVAVIVNGTPDHWHTPINVRALRAGKDVYSEKPLTLTIDEGKHLVATVRETKRVLQTGSQQRSDPMFRHVCELVRNGRLGKLQRVTTVLPAGLNEGPFRPAPVPEHLDWDLWLGQAPKVDYVPQRTHFSFRFWLDYSGGTITDWGAHHNDIALWAMGLDRSGPTTVQGRRLVEQIPGGYTAPSQYEVGYTYANGVTHTCRSTTTDSPIGQALREPEKGERRIGVVFEGPDGWIYVRRGHVEASDPELLKAELPSGAERLYASNDHMGNFFECVRTRKAPVAEAEIGHRSVSVCHLGGIAIRLGRKLQWDPDREQFTGDGADEANRQLAREPREPWGYRL